MSVCPICQNRHQQEVSQCQRCNWSMQDDLKGINSEHPILRICIPSIVQYLEDENKTLRSHLQILNLDIQKENNQKLNSIIDAIEDSKEQQNNTLKAINELLIELKALNTTKNHNSDIERVSDKSAESIQLLPNESSLYSSSFTGQPELDNEISNNSPSLGNGSQTNNLTNSTEYIEQDTDNNVFPVKSDRDKNNLLNINNNALENRVDNLASDHQYSKELHSQEHIEPNVSSSGSYQSFYDLIKNGELKNIEVKVPQETMEKMRGSTQSELKFVNDRKGNYWIVNWHEVYCLIPKEKTYINQYQYGNFQRIFDCQKYQENYSDFEVIEPATVFKCDDETWQLERKGKIKFI